MGSDQTTHAKVTGQYADVNGINLYYETHGSGRPGLSAKGSCREVGGLPDEAGL